MFLSDSRSERLTSLLRDAAFFLSLVGWALATVVIGIPLRLVDRALGTRLVDRLASLYEFVAR